MIQRTTMKQRTIFNAVRSLGYLVVALVVVTVYLIIPLMITFSPFIENNWGRLLAAVGLLVLVEVAVFRVLKKSSKEYEDYCAK